MSAKKMDKKIYTKIKNEEENINRNIIPMGMILEVLKWFESKGINPKDGFIDILNEKGKWPRIYLFDNNFNYIGNSENESLEDYLKENE
jgi:hypothetical protein